MATDRSDLPPHLQAMLGLPDASQAATLEPPFQVETVNFTASFCVFDKAAAQAALPDGLEAADTHDGFMCLYSAPRGRSIAPYACFFIGVFIKGHEAPDGSPGTFMAEGFYSGLAGPVMHERYNRRLFPGDVVHRKAGDVIGGHAGRAGEPPSVRLEVRNTGPVPPLTSGIHQYFGILPQGITTYSIAFSARYIPTEVISYEVLPGASDIIRSLTPIEWVWTSWMEQMPLTFGPPHLLASGGSQIAADADEVMLLDLLSRLGRGAVLMKPNVVNPAFTNAEARTLLGPLLRNGAVVADSARERQALERVIERARGTSVPGLSDPIMLRRPDTDQLIVVQAVHRTGPRDRHGEVLLLVTDPVGPSPGDSTAALELFGLTPAEARVASQVGAGLSPREAALALGITENTARSALRIVYSKLDIGRQSELAKIVARLEYLGGASQGMV